MVFELDEVKKNWFVKIDKTWRIKKTGGSS
jgi:hypothetical protein